MKKGDILITAMVFVVILGGMMLLSVLERREYYKYDSIEAIRTDIAVHNGTILEEAEFGKYRIFFAAEEDMLMDDPDEAAFYFRLFEKKRNGTYFQKTHSSLVPQGAMMEMSWSGFRGGYTIRYSVHEAGTRPIGADEGKWRYAHEGDSEGWHYSYEILENKNFSLSFKLGTGRGILGGAM